VNTAVYLVGGVLFVCGSLLFIPAVSEQPDRGAWLFIVGSVLYLLVTAHDAVEVMRHRARLRRKPTVWDRLEWGAAASYLLGTILFLVGSVCFLSTIDRRDVGAWCFVIGSLCFLCGATIDVLEIVRAPGIRLLQLMNLTALSFVGGSILFLVASIPYLLDLATASDRRIIDAFAAGQYAWGSLLFLAGGVFNFRRAALVAAPRDDVPES
jgi:hypothetical protein